MAKQGKLSRFLFGSYDKAPDATPEEATSKDEAPNAAPDDEAVKDAAAEQAPEASDKPDAPEVDKDAEAVPFEAPTGEGAVEVPDEASDEAPDDTPAEASVEVLVAEPDLETVEADNVPETDVPQTDAPDPVVPDLVVADPAIEAPIVAEAIAAQPETLEPEISEPEKKLSWFERLKQGLSRSSGALGEGITAIFTKRKLDDDTLQDLEDILIQADLGVETAMAITDRLSDGRYNKEVSDQEVKTILADEVEAVLRPVAQPLVVTKPESGPHVILMIGVNGAGKTTTIGKLAQKLGDEGKKVMLAAGDTFRAAAIDQLKVWGERTGCPVIARDVGSDAAGLAYDAMQEAKAADMDVLMIDTAGRLQNRTELMDELQKIVRVIKKHDEQAPHSVLLVLDATTGQNALNQVEVFKKMAGVTGLVMTKLDGTARGGILVAISAKHKVPVHFIGIGERVEDLEPFESGDFARVIAGLAG